MRVLQTPVRFAPAVGGVESHVREVSARLVDRGHQVTVVCADAVDGDAPATVDGAAVVRLTAPVTVSNTDVAPTLPIRLAREARAADVIHTHLPTPWTADVSAVVGAATGTPVVLTYHNDVVGEGVFDAVARLYNATTLRVTLRLADRVVVTSPDYPDRSPHLAGVAQKTAVVSNGVDVERFRPRESTAAERAALGFDPDRPNLFFLAVLDEFHEYKGLDVLLAALARLDRSSDRPPQLVVGGGGAARHRYETAARDRGLADHVTFVGHVPAADLPTAYSAADLAVVPSTDPAKEGFGLVALEALACGTAVVTTTAAGVAGHLSDAGCATVVTPGDAGALAEGIEEALRADESGACGGGRDLCVDRYSWEASVDDLEAVYEAVRRGSS